MSANDSGAVHAASSARLGWGAHLLALLGYFLLALLVTYPVVGQFASGVPGDLLADRDQNLWNLWWARESLFSFSNPFHTDLLYYPYGASLYYHTLALPLGLIGLVPQLLLGLAAAYNAVLLVGFTLSGYGMFRLFAFVQGPVLFGTETEEEAGALRIRGWVAAFVAGVVFAFTPYTLDALKGQPEVLSLQWMPLFLEMWFRAIADEGRRTKDEGRETVDEGRRTKDQSQTANPQPSSFVLRPSPQLKFAALAGLFLALTAYTSLYYAVYLVVFLVAYVAYRLVMAGRRGLLQEDIRAIARAGFVTAIVALVLGFPLLAGLVAHRNDPRLAVAADPEHRLTHSADLLSFFAPPHDHLLFGTWQDKPGLNEPPLHDYVGLGYVALALAVVGVVMTRRRSGVFFWAGLAILALILAMGPELQIGRNGTGIPLPFALLAPLPGMDAIAKPERFVVLARLCMGVLAGWGVVALLCGGVWGRPRSRVSSYTPELSWRGPSSRTLSVAGAIIILTGLLAELPIHPRYMETLADVPFYQAYKSLSTEPSGGLMELPFATQQSQTTGRRMLLQTVHDKPIMTGYLSRRYDSPIIDSCGPFWGFISASGVPREDIGSPLVANQLLDVLSFYNIRYLSLYSSFTGSPNDRVDADQLDALGAIANEMKQEGPPIYSGPDLSIYKVKQVDVSGAAPSFHLGAGWYPIEQSEGRPFRWVNGGHGSLCVFAPHAVTGTLTMAGTAFAQERNVTMTVGGETLFSGKFPTGAFAAIETTVRDWQPGVTQVEISAPEAGTSPNSLDPKAGDDRVLTVGLRGVKLEIKAK